MCSERGGGGEVNEVRRKIHAPGKARTQSNSFTTSALNKPPSPWVVPVSHVTSQRLLRHRCGPSDPQILCNNVRRIRGDRKRYIYESRLAFRSPVAPVISARPLALALPLALPLAPSTHTGPADASPARSSLQILSPPPRLSRLPRLP